MGWLFQHRDPGMSDREWFERELPETLTRYGHIVACATVKSVFYAAVQNHDDHPSEPGRTWALVVLVRRQRGAHNFGYKDMDEDMGPGDCEAPAAVLDALSPTTKEWALQWREECRRNLARKAALPKVKRGDVVVFAEPLTFSDGSEETRFTFEQRTTFTFAGRPVRTRIPNWRSRAHTVETAS